MRLGVLDVGSNTVHLLIVDAHLGAHPTPVMAERQELRLAELLERDGSLSPVGADRLVESVATSRRLSKEHGADDFVGFATSAVRDARNSAEVLDRVAVETGVELEVLSGDDEARMTFLAVRRWFGWSAGRLLCLDIGGGSLELATGLDELPEVAVSVPLGAGRMTRERLQGDPPKPKHVAVLREHVRATIEPVAGRLLALGEPDKVTGTSKTFRSLARLAGASPSSRGPRVRRVLTAKALADVVRRVQPMTAAERAKLGGVSEGRSLQLLAGAVVAEEAMRALDVKELEICPWALREGLILRRLDHLTGS
ncbi:MAG: Ppx/GppA family phosphatase [Actinomycetota bacterium]|nr:Ppx/GppA family phosphatase [Actinomycetota bacterium]